MNSIVEEGAKRMTDRNTQRIFRHFPVKVWSGSTLETQLQNKQTISPNSVLTNHQKDRGKGERGVCCNFSENTFLFLLFPLLDFLCTSGLMRTESFLSRVEDIKFKKKRTERERHRKDKKEDHLSGEAHSQFLIVGNPKNSSGMAQPRE